MTQCREAPNLDDLLTSLADAPERKRIAMGEVVCLGLEAVRRRIGEANWAHTENLVAQLVRKAIQRVCAPADTYLRCSDGSFVIVFASCNETIAKARSVKIAEIVNQALFGMEHMDGVTIHSAVETADGYSVDQGRSAAEVLTEMTERAARRELMPERVTAPELEKAETVTKRTVKAGNEEAPAPETIAGSGKKADIDPDPIPHCRDQLIAAMHGFDSAPITFKFIPIWRVGKPDATYFHCMPMRDGTLGAPPAKSYDVLGQNPPRRRIIELDLAAMEHSLLALAGGVRKQPRMRLSINLHFETLASAPGREGLMSLLNETPKALRDRLSCRISDIPPGAPEGRLAELTAQLAPRIETLTSIVEYVEPMQVQARQLRRLRAARIRVAFLRDPGEVSNDPLAYGGRFTRLCADIGIMPGISRVERMNRALQWSYAGFALMTGSVLGGPYDVPPPNLPINVGTFEAAGGRKRPVWQGRA
ncbi:hypothetical protein KAJ83_13790 [Marivibrio halodurans]|uniref:Uncharacterized protein n=1 Tax=Marivibrio halodurans TaxID=2039722 RepID=A0A8J7V3C3_9PROT|nr:hypothetical protein [Marivibrio halodurans]MBP5858086.1 hypothetical protein [Marivibrio halodurans]